MIWNVMDWGWLLLGAVIALSALIGGLLVLWWVQRHSRWAQRARPRPAPVAAPHRPAAVVTLVDEPPRPLPDTAPLTPAAMAPALAQAVQHAIQQALDQSLEPVLARQLDQQLGARLAEPLSQLLETRIGDQLDQQLERLESSLRTAAHSGHPVAAMAGRAPITAANEEDEAASALVHEQLTQARDQIAEQEQLTFSVSHDLRAPIRVVEGFARILKEDYGRGLDRIGLDHLDRILGAAARMNGMIDAVLALARLSSQPLQRQPVNLSQLAHYVIDDLQRSDPQRNAVFQVTPDLVCNGDPILLRILLDNLLGNAWKYSARRPQARIVLDANVRSDEVVVYHISDNGAGFDMRFADRLFGVFQRLHSASDFQGTGVGLASVRRIVRRHGGDIWADSVPGEGATFYFTLSATASPQPQSPAGPAVAA